MATWTLCPVLTGILNAFRVKGNPGQLSPAGTLLNIENEMKQRSLTINLVRMNNRPMPTNFIYDAVIAIKQSIDENPLQREAVHELEPTIHIGRNQLQHTFKEITGMTVRSYRLQKRMKAAKDMMATGEYSIKQIALECGYRNQNNFTADFKLVFKMAPSEWLEAHTPILYVTMDDIEGAVFIRNRANSVNRKL
jgi:AraC-like DNA-binding protein